MVAVQHGANGWGGGGVEWRAGPWFLVWWSDWRLMYNDCATLGASCGGATNVRQLHHTGGGLHAPVAP